MMKFLSFVYYQTAVSTVTRLWLDDPCFDPQQAQEIFSSPKCPDQLWGPPSFLFDAYQGFIPLSKIIDNFFN
jgi:hypothetical protein